MIRERIITVTAKDCTCDVCGHTWTSLIEGKPKECASHQCRTKQWDGKGKPSYINTIKFPAPRKGGRPKAIALIDQEEI